MRKFYFRRQLLFGRITLKGAGSPAEWAGAVHNGRHLDDYGRIVSKRLRDADLRGGKEAVYQELNAIRNELFEGGELANLISRISISGS